VRAAIRRSPVARLASRRGAVFVDEAGWEVPASFGDDAAERSAIRERVAIADVTARAKVDVRGAVPLALPVPADVTLARISPGWALLLAGPNEEQSVLEALAPVAATPDVMVTDATHLHAGFALVGPDVSRVLERVTPWDHSALGPGQAQAAPIVEVPAVVVRGAAAPSAVEIYVPVEYGRYAWQQLVETVASVGGAPVGWQALRAEGWR
jgi:glycine cleavage system aminomethyltransferase T